MQETESRLYQIRHSCAHVLAQAVLTVFPDAKLGIGPPIDHGFYYDFELPRALVPEDLPVFEKKMKQIIKQNQRFELKEVNGNDAVSILEKEITIVLRLLKRSQVFNEDSTC